MFIFFECAACLILVAIVATLLFTVSALLMVIEEGATILGHLVRRMAHGARVLVARQTVITSLIWEVEGPMKKTLLVLLSLAVWMTFVQAKEPSKPTNFSGNWALNFGPTKNPPDGLQGYSLLLNQDEQQLKLETTLLGDLQSTPNTPNSGGYPGGSGRRGGMGGGLGLPGGIGIGMGIPGIGMGIPHGGGGRSRSTGPSQGNVAAYKLCPQSVVYKLDGSEGTAQLCDREQTNATSKAERAKNEVVLKLSLMANGDSGNSGDKIQINEQWKLSEDAKSLRVDRSIKSPEGSGTAHLVFLKREADTASAASLSNRNTPTGLSSGLAQSFTLPGDYFWEVAWLVAADWGQLGRITELEGPALQKSEAVLIHPTRLPTLQYAGASQQRLAEYS